MHRVVICGEKQLNQLRRVEEKYNNWKVAVIIATIIYRC